MLIELAEVAQDQTFDVVVIGAGGAGMSAALFAAIEGASVLLVERTEYVGGTTAFSGGTTWIPGTVHAAAVSEGDTLEVAEAYLTRAIGNRTPAALRRAFLDNGSRAIAHVEANSEVKYRAYPLHPDYLSEIEGSTLRGRALEPLPFDGRKLGALFALVRPPIPEFTVLGGMMVDRNDIFHLLRLTKSVASLHHGLKLVARHAADRLHSSRGTRMVRGNSLIGRLLYSLAQRPNVSLLTQTSVECLHLGEHAVSLRKGSERRRVRARGGIILASGGFNRHARLRSELLRGAEPGWCPGAPGHTGEAHDLAWDGPNPSLGALTEAPFHAVRLYPGDIGAATGFVTEANGQVLDNADRPMAGLYAVGNDMHSIMGGVYPGPGITLGPALVFGYLAGRHASRRARAVLQASHPDPSANRRRQSA